MRNLIILITVIILGSCSKSDSIEVKKGKILFYSDAFVALNCKLDSISIYINNNYKGKLSKSFLPLSQIPNESDSNTLTIILPIGNYSFSTKMAGCSSNKWDGTLEIVESECKTVNLNYSTSKP